MFEAPYLSDKHMEPIGTKSEWWRALNMSSGRGFQHGSSKVRFVFPTCYLIDLAEGYRTRHGPALSKRNVTANCAPKRPIISGYIRNMALRSSARPCMRMIRGVSPNCFAIQMWVCLNLCHTVRLKSPWSFARPANLCKPYCVAMFRCCQIAPFESEISFSPSEACVGPCLDLGWT